MMHIAPTASHSRSLSGRPTLLSLERGAWRWPIGDPREPDFALCGAPAAGRYCPVHARRGRARVQPYGPVVPGIDDIRAPEPQRFASPMDRWV